MNNTRNDKRNFYNYVLVAQSVTQAVLFDAIYLNVVELSHCEH